MFIDNIGCYNFKYYNIIVRSFALFNVLFSFSLFFKSLLGVKTRLKSYIFIVERPTLINNKLPC